MLGSQLPVVNIEIKPTCHTLNIIINKRSKHLCLQETGQKSDMTLNLNKKNVSSMTSKPAWLEPVHSRTDKSYKASYYRQFSTIIKMKIIKLIPVLLARIFDPTGQTTLISILIFFI